jgi:hypothetical protein
VSSSKNSDDTLQKQLRNELAKNEVLPVLQVNSTSNYSASSRASLDKTLGATVAREQADDVSIELVAAIRRGICLRRRVARPRSKPHGI